MNKHDLRTHAKLTRNRIPTDQFENAKHALRENIQKFLSDKQGLVGTYYPIGSEIHPPHHIDGYKMALPVIRDKETLEFYEWTQGDKLNDGRFDIPIPKTAFKKSYRPDIILLPLLLCDAVGNRIGYGAGHYDRYIASCTNKPTLIGVCFDDQIHDEVIPAEEHDQKLDLIITPKRIIEVS
jgi:5-formyltetrahydrofolate cyclo-ligase